MQNSSCIIYVNAANNSKIQDGSSWRYAFKDLQAALDIAAKYPYSQIWVAKGTYIPTRVYSPNGVVGGLYGQNRPELATFNLPNGVSIYGGFNGTECKRCERNLCENKTILSGANVLWHVVIAGNDTVPRTPVYARLNDLIIREGNARGPFGSTSLEPFTYDHSSGAGIYFIYDSVLQLKNVSLSRNNAANLGAGMLSVNATPLIKSSSFIANFSQSQAGGLAIYNTYNNTVVYEALVKDTLFEGNGTVNFGGGVVVEGVIPADASSVKFKGCKFTGNYALEGGAVVVDSITATFKCCLFVKNRSYVNGGALATTNIVSTIIAASQQPPQIFNNKTTYIVDCQFLKNITEGNAYLRQVILGNPMMLGISFPIGGGALVSYLNGLLHVTKSQFKSNKALNSGGGAILNGKSSGSMPLGVENLTVYAASTSVYECEFFNNEAVNGGAIASEKDDVVFTPAIVVNPANIQLTVNKSLFVQNKALKFGGAIYSDTSAVILGCNVYKCNKAGEAGNALYLLNSILNDHPTELVVKDNSCYDSREDGRCY